MNKNKKSLGKRRIYITNTFLFLSISGVLIWSIRTFFHLDSESYTDDAQIEEFINPINSKVQGYIQEVYFKEHQKINKGDTLIVIDDREYQIRYSQAEAVYLNALASEEVAQNSIVTLENNIDISKANIQANLSTLSNVRKNYQRYKNLFKEKVVTKAQLENIETQYESLKLKIDALKEKEESTLLAIKEARIKLRIHKAKVKSAKASLEMSQLNMDYCTIIAPYDCTVGRKKIQKGQLIQPGQQLLSIIKENEAWVVANFKEKQMPYIHIGTKVEITVDALNDQHFEGVITAISGASGSKYSAIPIDNSTGNFIKIQQRFPVRIDFKGSNFPNDFGLLKAGMNVTVSISH
ncbi:MAG: HlyD family secretion protein [Prolixibacteraceae bacterium]|jgi:membrane fusion protein (multidrug efflux system)|nr:HlyD family secretion protein [Prolixibacteraceae bacterium]